MGLWLHPSRTPVVVRLKRFDRYPYFLETLAEHSAPAEAVVRWGSTRAWTEYLIEADDEEQAEDVAAFIRSVAQRIADDEDVPPLVRGRGGEIIDGRHRAFAAESIGLRRAPIIVL